MTSKLVFDKLSSLVDKKPILLLDEADTLIASATFIGTSDIGDQWVIQPVEVDMLTKLKTITPWLFEPAHQGCGQKLVQHNHKKTSCITTGLASTVHILCVLNLVRTLIKSQFLTPSQCGTSAFSHFWYSELNAEIDSMEGKRTAYCYVDGELKTYNVAGNSVNGYVKLMDKEYKGYGIAIPKDIVMDNYHALLDSYYGWYYQPREK